MITKVIKISYYFQNDSNVPIMDAVLFINKQGKSVEEAKKSRNSMEVVFGTIPPHTTLDYKTVESDDDNEQFGFPLLSGQFTSKEDRHYEIDIRNKVKEIPFRASFD